MKLVRQIKMCLNETCSEVRVGVQILRRDGLIKAYLEVDDGINFFEIYSAFLPICTVATLLKRCPVIAVQDFGCDSNPHFRFFDSMSKWFLYPRNLSG
jgi:hypothetical protein